MVINRIKFHIMVIYTFYINNKREILIFNKTDNKQDKM